MTHNIHNEVFALLDSINANWSVKDGIVTVVTADNGSTWDFTVPKQVDNPVVTAAKALLSDIQAMRNTGPNRGIHATSDYFGPFEERYEPYDEYPTMIQWCNLAISADALQKALNEHTAPTLP